jgi:hypothetical protein
MPVEEVRGIVPGARVEAAEGILLVGWINPRWVRSLATAMLSLMAFNGLIAPAHSGDAIPATAARPDESRLRTIVTRLASPEFSGRSGEGGRKAAEFLVDEFRRLGLEPGFGETFIQEIPGREPGSLQGRNVGGIIRGTDDALKDEWVVIGTHYDHLGVRDGRIYPGADDNASGVAMMLETARTLKTRPKISRRSVLFLGFDLEEIGLFGSRYFAAHPAVPMEKIALFVTADMIGRSLAGICEREVFIFGTEHAPVVRPWIAEAAIGKPLNVGILGADILVLNRSDYGPFRSRGVPFLFFTTGENPRYHSHNDDAESLNYPKLTAISRLIADVVERAVSVPEAPKWKAVADNPIQEAIAIRNVLTQLLANRDRLKIRGPQVFLMTNTLKSLDTIIQNGVFSEADRTRIIQVARIVLFTVL